jgi:hypothetical protein
VEDGASRLLLPGTSTLCVVWRPLFENIRARFIDKGNFLDYSDLIEQHKKLRITNESFGCTVRLALRNGESEAVFQYLHFRYGEVMHTLICDRASLMPLLTPLEIWKQEKWKESTRFHTNTKN